VRVNSQSGKGGIAFLLQRDHGVVMPRRMQVEFSAIVQKLADASETELGSAEIWSVFARTYLAPTTDGAVPAYRGHRLFDAPQGQGIALDVVLADGTQRQLQGVGTGPIDATAAALGLPLRIDSYEERSLGTGADAQAMAIVEAAWPGVAGSRFGAGRDANIVTASVRAVFSAAARFGGFAQGQV
jgi:2-isopropylmalate synthase